MIATLVLAFAPASLPASPQSDREVKQGNAMFATAQHEGKIADDSAATADVAPITAKLFPILRKSYGAPFAVAFVRSSGGDPDAYTLIGPRIYIDTAFPGFIKDRDSLAGVMCHEASHVLHHDALRSQRNAKSSGIGASLARHTRSQEERADLTGAQICAQAGFNPWGIVWALQRFEQAYGSSSAKPPILADHPSVSVRIARLRRYITSNPKPFGRWKNDESTATSL